MAGYTQLQEDDVRRIAGDYGLTVVDFEPMEGGAANSSYLLRTRRGRYVLTVFELASDRAIRVGRTLLLLAEHGFPTSRLVPPVGGGVATTHEGKPVLLKTHVAGHVHRDLSEAMLRQVGATLARLHQIPPPDFLPEGHSYGQRVFSDVVGQGVDPGYESWLTRQLDHFKRRVPPGLPRGLTHGDLFYDNVLFQGRKLEAIIDFDEACHEYKAFDLGMTIVGMHVEGTAIALDKARALVAGYQQVRTLATRERESLQLFVEYAATATSSWRFWKYHIDAPSADRADRHRQMVRLAKGVRAIPRERFLAAVFD